MADEIPPLWIDTQPEFHQLLGRFVTSFAFVETSLRMLIGNYANLPDWKTRAIFGGESAADIMRHLRALTAGNPNPEQYPHAELLEYVLQQINVIAEARHSLVHEHPRAIELTFEKSTATAYEVNNIFRAKRVADIRYRHFELDHLVQMLHDCRTIHHLLDYVRNGEHVVFPEMIPRAQNLSPDAWLYKPDRPKRRAPKQKKAPRSPKRPLPPSPA